RSKSAARAGRRQTPRCQVAKTWAEPTPGSAAILLRSSHRKSGQRAFEEWVERFDSPGAFGRAPDRIAHLPARTGQKTVVQRLLRGRHRDADRLAQGS